MAAKDGEKADADDDSKSDSDEETSATNAV